MHRSPAGLGSLTKVAALAGGVGAARLLRGAVEVVDPDSVVAVVNTGDDFRLHGLTICPDLDTVTYTLADAVPPAQGWGLAGETWSAMGALARYEAVVPAGSGAAATWFRLGDRDLATHLYRTHRLGEGVPLSVVTAEVAAAWKVGARLLPMSDEVVATVLHVPGEGDVAFQDYFVRRRHSVAVDGVRFVGAEQATPAPGVLEAIAGADAVLLCPSNPIVSIGPILAVPGVADAVAARRERTVAVSPIVAGAALKGPADRLLGELAHEVSVVGVARIYRRLAATLVVDEADAAMAGAVEALGVRCVVAPAIMHGVAEAAALASVALEAAGRL